MSLAGGGGSRRVDRKGVLLIFFCVFYCSVASISPCFLLCGTRPRLFVALCALFNEDDTTLSLALGVAAANGTAAASAGRLNPVAVVANRAERPPPCVLDQSGRQTEAGIGRLRPRAAGPSAWSGMQGAPKSAVRQGSFVRTRTTYTGTYNYKPKARRTPKRSLAGHPSPFTYRHSPT